MADLASNLQQDALCEIQDLATPKFRRPFVPVKFCNMKIKGLYDTGADISCIDEKLFREIPIPERPKQILEEKRNSFKSASGDALTVKGKYLLKLQIGDKKLAHEFFVIKNLSEKMILGIDFILSHQLTYNVENRTFDWGKPVNWTLGRLKTRKVENLEGLSITTIKAKIETSNGFIPKAGTVCMVNIVVNNKPGLTGGPTMVTIDQDGLAQVPITCCAPFATELARGEEIGVIENIDDCERRELNPEFINSIDQQEMEKRMKTPITPAKKKFILETAKLDTVPPTHRERYRELLIKYHEAVSQHKFDLGRTETLMHDISLKTEEPVYVKQFKIPDAHRAEVERHVAEWLKLGVVQPCRSKYNSPLFVVMKKNGGVRLVQDFRALNAQTHMDKYSMKDVSECISDIGRAGSSIFTAIDLTAGFWQMLLHPRSRPYTAFTVPGQGQFQWVTTPMGLLGSPSSFQRLIETVMHNMQNVLIYIDDILLHTHTHEEHLKIFEEVLKRLVRHGIKMNLEKCIFASKEVSYLGFRLTEQGIKPGSDKLKAVSKVAPPSSIKEVRQFLGLCNFFRNHVRNFAQISAPLVEMVKKDCGWKGGELPTKALQSFRELQSYLCSEPVVDYPRKDRAYALITDASLGDDKKPGGLGAILAQVDKQGKFYVIAYASRGLQVHERNYTPFLLEMQACLWGMDHFETYLKGRHFTLFTDHKPLEKLGKVHTKTLNRLQEAMNQFDFEILYKKGSEMPADFLSRNVVNSISLSNEKLIEQQDLDPFIKLIKAFLLNRQLPANHPDPASIRRLAFDCFLEDGLVWRRIKRNYEPSRVVLLLPQSLKNEVMQQAHGTLMAGHDGTLKTKERILSCYYWNGMDKDINDFIQQCHKCQLRKPSTGHSPALLTPLPQGTEPNQRVHADLFGPLRASDGNKKFILCITDSFTKYVELVALENKEAATVATALFDKWFCRYGIPGTIITDQGKEFCARLTEELFKRLGTLHTTTTPHHPQCNSQAEVANKTIAKYLSSFVDDSTLDWEKYLAPMMFSYNTSFHRSIKTTPFFLTFGIEPRQPGFPETDLRRKFYGENNTDELLSRLQIAREVARYHNEEATSQAQTYHDKNAGQHLFQVGQLVLLNEPYYLHKNAKLAPKWTGPHRVTDLKNHNNVEIQLAHNNKKLVVHANRLKIYNAGCTQDFTFPDFVLKGDRLIKQKVEKEKTHDDFDHDYFDLQPQPRQFEDAHTRADAHPPSAPSQPLKTQAQARYENLPPQNARPSNILVRLGPTASPMSKPEGGVQVQEIISLVDGLNDVDDDVRLTLDDENDDDQWILVTRRKKRKQKGWTKAQQQGFLSSGDVLNGPPSYKSSQSTFEEEDDNIQPQVPIQQQIQPPHGQPAQQQPQGQHLQLPQQLPNQPLGPAPQLPGGAYGPVGGQPQQQQPVQAPAQAGANRVDPHSGQRARVGSDQDRRAPKIGVEARVLPENGNNPGAAPRGRASGAGVQAYQSASPGDRGGTTGAGIPAHQSRKSPSFRSQPTRFLPYTKSNQTGESQILFRLQSGVPEQRTEVLPGVHDPLSKPSVLVSTESGIPDDQPRVINPNVPLWKQGWAGDSSFAAGATPKRRSTDEKDLAGARPAVPPQPATRSSRTSGSDLPIYENLNPFEALKSGAQSKVSPEQPEEKFKTILKKTSDPTKVKKSVKYSPSTKGSRPAVAKRPPTPDLEISIRPTSALDIFDEIVAGQPSQRIGGQTIPDTLIQISEPAAHDPAKRSKKNVPPTDRILRPKPKVKK